ncbi:glycogen operon protein GlgX homolog [Marmoricola endophyticus]|uniref:Glycogen operon protein GlgX homolog n=1 Tax=Marmoricola endophyticus TaxID=2040280 RepID=A0A917F3T0_9ACTN|nr:glycogen debranching protein GlgX [Marmoricola endophyticus]GGF39919.1 glycogen operon protein GlgX homolog [Marmoricola endophyticus]
MTQTRTFAGPSWQAVGENAPVWPGRNWPLGATWSPESTNFAVHAPDATQVWVCLFDDASGVEVETRHPLTEQSQGIWHGALPDLPVGQRYGFRADGPWEPDAGLVFNPAKLLQDPYARATSGRFVEHPATYGYAQPAADVPVRDPQDSGPYVGRSVVVHDDFDWGGEAPIRRRWRDTVVYELHVKGFTALHDRIPEELRGTYAGLGHPVVTDYLTDLGVTAVELLPVHVSVSEPHLAEQGLVNYWGYSSLGFFAPDASYSSSGDRGQQVTEFKAMVKAMHAAGIEVLLDVVYNHTAEQGPLGRTLSFRGLDDLGYYQRAEGDPAAYWDVTGCGNTVAAYRPHVLRLILDSLRYWVTEMHVDGFRFDLMSAIARTGHDIDLHGQVLGAMNQDPVLRHVKLVAEPWDCSAEGYQVGNYPAPWTEWNDRYRDTVRDFWRAGGDGIRTLATRLAGSADLYADDGRSPAHSVNYVTAHDGFTVRDLVSYAHKHNEANGEDNRDGTDDNRSWNCGVEGETDDPAVTALRRRQAANLMATLCLSAGVPMLTAGDERGRTQRGNNNAYGQDNEISWVDWRAEDAWLDVYDVTRAALRIRREHRTLRQRHFFEGRPTIDGGAKDLAWIHPEGRELTDSDWADPTLHVLGMFVSGEPLRSPGPRGEQQWDSSFLLWANGSGVECEVRVPANPWVQKGSVVLSTDARHVAGVEVEAGQGVALAARSLLLLRQDPRHSAT